MSEKFVSGVTFVTEECCSCGMSFAMTADFRRRRLADHKFFYCPKGHQQYYTGKSEAQKLKEQLEATQRRYEAASGRAIAIERQRDEVVRAHRKMRERVKNGVCPCCDRTFQNLLNHMRTQHPEFNGGQQLKILRDTFGLTQKALAEEVGINQGYISLYERNQPLSEHAEGRIEAWIVENAG